jgi:hypothetical protein
LNSLLRNVKGVYVLLPLFFKSVSERLPWKTKVFQHYARLNSILDYTDKPYMGYMNCWNFVFYIHCILHTVKKDSFKLRKEYHVTLTRQIPWWKSRKMPFYSCSYTISCYGYMLYVQIFIYVCTIVNAESAYDIREIDSYKKFRITQHTDFSIITNDVRKTIYPYYTSCN